MCSQLSGYVTAGMPLESLLRSRLYHAFCEAGDLSAGQHGFHKIHFTMIAVSEEVEAVTRSETASHQTRDSFFL